MLCQVRAVSHSCLYKPGNSQPGRQSSHPQTESAQQVPHVPMPLYQGKLIPPSSSVMNFLSSYRQETTKDTRVDACTLVMHLQMAMSKDALAGNVFAHAYTYGSAFPFANQQKGEEGRSFRPWQEISFFSPASPWAWQGVVPSGPGVWGSREGGSHLGDHMKMINTAHIVNM